MAKKPLEILIIEDEEVILDVLSKKLEKAGYRVHKAKNGTEGIKALKELKPDVALLDIIMPKQDGYDVLRAAQEDTSINHIPIIIISNSGQPVEIDKALQLGAIDYLIKAQFEPEEVIEKLEQALQNMRLTGKPKVKINTDTTATKQAPPVKKSHGPLSILIVEDDQFLRELVTRKLDIEGYIVSTATNGSEGYKKILQEKPGLVLLDIILPEMNGFEVLEKVRDDKDKSINSIPIVMLSNLGQESDIKRGQELGANDYLVKASLTTDEIVKKIESFL